MRPSKVFLAALLALTALLLQLTAVDRLHLPDGRPDLVVLVLAASALVEGPVLGMCLGFGAGLVADLLGNHLLGRLALLFTLIGYGVGLLREEEEGQRSAVMPLLVIGSASLVASLADAGLGVVLGDPRVSAGSVLRGAAAAALYDVLLTPFVYPAVRVLFRRLEPEHR
ncbi:MAG: rod shape-determining protein MreD [Mycobacteriales bacterium]